MNNASRHTERTSGKGKRSGNGSEGNKGHSPADDAPAPKRQRVSRACDSCRSKKDKCDGAQPVCSTCAVLCRPCTYKAHPKKRGLPTGYIRTLELLWGLVFQKIPGSEESTRALLNAENIPDRLATMGKDGEGSDLVLSTWKNSGLLRDVERMLATLEHTDEEDRKLEHGIDTESAADTGATNARFIPVPWQIPEGLLDSDEGVQSTRVPPRSLPTSAHNQRLVPYLTATVHQGTQTEPSIGMDRDDVGSAVDPPDLASSQHPSTSSNSSVRLPLDAWMLFDIYFAYTHCWFPIVEKHDILRTAYSYNEVDVRTSSRPGSGDHAALWAVLTLASFQTASSVIESLLGVTQRDQTSPTIAYTFARSFIPSDEEAHFELGHSQALLLLALVNLGRQNWTSAWVLVGHAIRILQSLGFDSGDSSGRARHVFLGCFIVDTLLALSLPCQPCLRVDQLAKVGFLDEDGLEEWHPWEDTTILRTQTSAPGSLQREPMHALSTFNRLAALVSIGNKLCWALNDTTTTPSLLFQLEGELQTWCDGLHQSYRPEIRGQTTLGAPHIFFLEMTYHSLLAALHHGLEKLHRDQPLQYAAYNYRAADSSSRLLAFAQAYAKRYSMLTASPILGVLLRYCLSPRAPAMTTPAGLESQAFLSQQIQSMSAELRAVWATPEEVEQHTPRMASHSGIGNENPSVRLRRGMALSSEGISRPQPEPRRSQITGGNVTTEQAQVGTINEPTGFVTPRVLGTSFAANSSSFANFREFDRATPHLGTSGAADNKAGSATQGPYSISLQLDQTPMTLVSTGVSTFQHLEPYGQPPYADEIFNLGSTALDEAHRPAARSRIAPDLDSLFEELASLDGTERFDEEPDFMKNLGFITETALHDLFASSNETPPTL